MSSLPDLAGGPVDVAVVPVWGWGPRLSGGHLSPEDAARAVALAGARFAVPVHWGTLHPPWALRLRRDWFDLPGEWFTAAAARHCPGDDDRRAAAGAVVVRAGVTRPHPGEVMSQRRRRGRVATARRRGASP